MVNNNHIGRHRSYDAAADFIIRMRWIWPVLAVLLTAVAVMRLDVIMPPEADSRIFFDEDNPERIALEDFEATFNQADNVMIVIEARDGEIFEPTVLSAIGDITETAWLLPYVRRVDSVTNYQYSRADGDDLIVSDLIESPSEVTIEEANSIKEIALDRIELVNRFLAPNSDVSMVQVLFTLPQEGRGKGVPETVAAIYELRDTFETKYPQIDIRLSGSVMLNHQFAVSSQQDIRELVLPMFLAVLVIIWLAVRSISGTLSILAVMVCSALSGLGVLGWAGLPLNATTGSSPLYIMILAVAASVHVLTAIRQNMQETSTRKEWIKKALAEHMDAIIVTGVSTAIGFFCLNFSVSPPIRQLGNVVGVGVLATTFYSLTLLPSLLIWLPMKRHTGSPAVGRAMDALAEFVIARRKMLLPTMAILALIMVSGMTKLVFEDNLLRYFDERYEFRQDTDFTENRLTGVLNLNFALESGGPGQINDPDFLSEVSAFTGWLRAQPEVAYVSSLTDTISRLNMNLNGDDPSQYRLPDTRTEIGDLLFMYELSLGYGMDLTDQIDIDRQILRLGAFLPYATTAQMRDLTHRAGGWFKENAPNLQKAWNKKHPDIETISPTGLVHAFNLITHRDVRSMITGTLLAFFLISGVIMLMLRSVRMGMISLIPNLIPAAMSFGLWGYGVSAVSMAIAAVLTATLGIVVDDTVHFLSKYFRARKAAQNPEDSVRYAFRSIGMALVVSTVSLLIGFAILAQSGFAVNGDFAKLTAMTILLALIADFLLLPPLLIWLDKREFRIRRTRRPLPQGGHS